MAAQGRRILVVDDSPELCDFLQMLLEGEGYAVQTSGSANAARQALTAWKPDAVITDVCLPDAPPFALLDALNGSNGAARVPVLLCTGAVNEVRAAAERLRQDKIPVLIKPFELEDLLRAVGHLLEGRSVVS